MRDRKKTGRFFDLLTDDTFKSREFYNHKAIEKLVDEHLYQKKDHSKFLSKFINFEIWHRLFIDISISI